MVETTLPAISRKTNQKKTDIISDTQILETESPVLFSDLGLSASIMRAVDEIGYKTPTLIQAQAIPVILQKQDLVGIAQTGTGKTASFTLPILEILTSSKGRARMPRALILEPTRELAIQVAENLKQYGQYLKLTHALLVGGESIVEQKDTLNRGVDIIIATPGRLMDLFEKGAILLNQIKILVIDEADRMLDMGFIPDVEKIISYLPKSRQTLLLSATMAPEIKRLTESFLSNPTEITVAPPSSVATTIESGLVIVPEKRKRATLRQLLRNDNVKNAIIFCNRKKDVDILTRSLNRHGFQSSALHGDLTQQHRTKTMEEFKNGDIQYLVCSDIAARGIDIDNLSHVFNFDLPRQAEDYVHRIGRTGRAGRTGFAYSIATDNDKETIEAIEALIQKSIPLISLNKPETADTEKDQDTKKQYKSKEEEQKKTTKKQHFKKEKTIVPRVPLSQAIPDDDNPVIGFGQFVPAFMLSPFRK
ncbi:Superfamily II DNA and RNA helicase (SrmB) (PDB:3RRM) [Commensalibacter communis]|uniref:DEAD-box ATP-dependent RNA helicase RhpA n=1 Tax=Commensalibacter communis TaxID=2972786 RepID=A0A9W4X937_9PROT|nr:DEAD/DEAH box helicase [Commensalibacter communis]CAI3929497.1 Superfamily II DNA and RNA helicase (SrmB) (PDB:3RRM) [Commensalibacter communis]CAI3930074.1 Superfamily II DNA and RNA helicase (SrmB) (PDB:3RRM) [Commensalibacter communis]CAI3931407.1 Superfamily II DNA and RNA helicase (SrmB) (PDB:3RRM) [Commensalibacter communis]CAI3932918.1 Superfamily II DNA and RNA helicase (SrmB) (PDB:3RRM) [Commensalibacter communis]